MFEIFDEIPDKRRLEEFAIFLQEVMDKTHQTVNELAKSVDIHRRTVKRWLDAEGETWNRDRYQEFLKALDKEHCDFEKFLIRRGVLNEKALTSTSFTRSLNASPYVGLSSFTQEDADKYFGRTDMIAEVGSILKNKIEASCTKNELSHIPRIIILHGPSGEGKSSLLNAGLIPYIQHNMPNYIEELTCVVFKPGESPLDRLSDTLFSVFPNNRYMANLKMADRLQLLCVRDNSRYINLCRIVNSSFDDGNQHLLLCIDQFEEIFTYTKSSVSKSLENDSAIDKQKAFVGNIVEAACMPHGKISIILTMRSEYMKDVQNYPKLSELITNHGYYVHSMNENEIRECITGPMKLTSHVFDEDFISVLVEATLDRTGSLPLLQYTLNYLWNGLQNGQNPLQQYYKLGGGLISNLVSVVDKLVDHVTKIFPNIGAEIIERSFVRMVRNHGGGVYTKRRILLSQLVIIGESQETIRDILRLFSTEQNRFLTFTLNDTDSEIYVEITHEALISNWPRLNSWIEKHKDVENFFQKMEAAAILEEKNKGSLWSREPEINEIQNYYNKHPERFQGVTLDFYKKSVRARKILSSIYVGVMCILFLLLVLTSVFYAEEKQTSAKNLLLIEANASEIANYAILNEDNQKYQKTPELIYQALSQANKTDWDSNVTSMLTGILMQRYARGLQAILQPSSNDKASVLYDVANDSIVTAHGRIITIWSNQGDILHQFKGHEENVTQIQLRPLDNAFLTVSSNYHVKVWTIQGDHKQTLKHNKKVKDAKYSADGKTIITASDDHLIRIWDENGNIQSTAEFPKAIANITPNVDGTKLLVITEDNNVLIWDEKTQERYLLDVDTNTKIRYAVYSTDNKHIYVVSHKNMTIFDHKGVFVKTVVAHKENINHMVLSHSGKYILTASNDGAVKLWSNEGEFLQQYNHDYAVNNSSISQNEKYIVSVGERGAVQLWNIQGERIRSYNGHGGNVESVKFVNNEHFITTDENHSPFLWRCCDPFPLNLRHSSSVKEVTISPDSEHIITLAYDQLARLWDNKGNLVRELGGHSSHVNSAAFTMDGNKIITAGGFNAIIWNKNGERINTLSGHSAVVTYAAFSKDGSYAITTSKDETARLWNSNGELLAILDSQNGDVNHALFLDYSNNIVTSSSNGSVKLWDISGNLKQVFSSHHSSALRTMQLSDNTLLTSHKDGTSVLWTLDGEKINSITASQISMDKNFERIVGLANDDSQNLNEDMLGKYYRSNIDQLLDSTLSADGVFAHDGMIAYWDYKGELVNTMQPYVNESGISNVYLSPNKSMLFLATYNGDIQVYDRHGKKLQSYKHYKNKIGTIEFSPNNEYFVTAANNQTAGIWEMLNIGDKKSTMLWACRLLGAPASDYKLWNCNN